MPKDSNAVNYRTFCMPHSAILGRTWSRPETAKFVQTAEPALGISDDRIQGALANVGYHISDSTVGNVLKEHGIEPAPDRKRQTTWKTFIKSHWDVLAAIDFTTIEVWTKGGLVTYYLLFVMELCDSSCSLGRLHADSLATIS